MFRATRRAQDQRGSELVRGRRDSTRSRTRSHASAGSSWRIAIRAEPFQAGRYDGSPSHPAGCDSDSLPPGPNSLLSEGSTSTWWRALVPMPGCRDFRCCSGTTCGNHRANYPRHLGASSGMVFAVQIDEPTRKAGRNPYPVPPYERGITSSNPVCAHQPKQSAEVPSYLHWVTIPRAQPAKVRTLLAAELDRNILPSVAVFIFTATAAWTRAITRNLRNSRYQFRAAGVSNAHL